MDNPYDIRVQAERIVGEDRVPADVLVGLLEQAGMNASGLDPYELRTEAERVIGEDRLATDVLSDLVETYGADEDADRDA